MNSDNITEIEGKIIEATIDTDGEFSMLIDPLVPDNIKESKALYFQSSEYKIKFSNNSYTATPIEEFIPKDSELQISSGYIQIKKSFCLYIKQLEEA